VALTVVDAQNAFDTEILLITALPPENHPPVASPTATPSAGNAPLSVQFVANASDPDGDILTYSWNFGDGATSTVADPSHTYATRGTFYAWLTVSDGQATASASRTITVSPTIELNVTRADIDFRRKTSALANVSIRAELYASLPGPDDLVALFLDGDRVLAVPFGQFVPAREWGQAVPGVYKLKAKDLWVVVDFTEGRLSLEADKVMLPSYNPKNGVDVEVMLGDATAVDNIQPVDDDRGEHHYKHRRPERGRGNCHH
jgi:hypothetical protein